MKSFQTLTSAFPKPVYLGAATRSPIGRFGGSLSAYTAPELAAVVLKEAIRRSPEVASVDWVMIGHARQAGAGPNPARQTVILSGLPEEVPAMTFNQACASGLSALITGVEKIALGRARSVWAGGVESMSNTPYFLPEARWGKKMGHLKAIDGMVKDGFFCPMSQMLMGETVETFLAKEMEITREEQDEFALSSQERAAKAWKSGFFKNETFKIPTHSHQKGDSEDAFLETDEHRREGTTLESLAKLSPVFDLKRGSVTAGNSSGITDGAAFVHLSDEKYPHMQVEVLDYEVVALDPKRMGLGPVPATLNLLKRHALKAEDLEAVEINEAFAAQVLACQRELKIPQVKMNAWGGAIALGHPIGATGVRIVVTLSHRLKGKKGALGLATLCVSGGQGVAVLVRSLG
jgi:acetyl-CoA C-acetyltransferase